MVSLALESLVFTRSRLFAPEPLEAWLPAREPALEPLPLYFFFISSSLFFFSLANRASSSLLRISDFRSAALAALSARFLFDY